MQLPMTGSWSVQVMAVRPFTIHGDIYWELQVRRIDDASGDVLIRVPQHAVKVEPVVGQTVSIAFLMGQVTLVTPIVSSGVGSAGVDPRKAGG